MSMSVRNSSNRQKSMFWKPIPWKVANEASQVEASQQPADLKKVGSTRSNTGTHPLVNTAQNELLRAYETETKAGFDKIESVLKAVLAEQSRLDFKRWANGELFAHLGVTLDESAWDLDLYPDPKQSFQALFSKVVFAQFSRLSEDFFVNDPIAGMKKQEATRIFRDAGIHAVGVAPCADGRLAHFVSYVLRLPYSSARRKARAGALFDVSESVRDWVFIEHTRFRDGFPNRAEEPTRYLKMAVYHFSKADPSHQGCAAHGNNDAKAAQAALQKLKDLRQAIENRFGCGSTVETILMGLNTDDDSLKIHIPNEQGKVCLDRYIETDKLFKATIGLTAKEARHEIEIAIDQCNLAHQSTVPKPQVKRLLAWMIEHNFSQIEYVNQFEHGCYDDIGHAERFIGIGSGFEEVQLRNLSFYSYLDTVEEGVNDVDIGIKIFKGLNIKRGVPIPIIIRCDYDGRVPESKERAAQKALRIEKAVHNRYQELSSCGLLHTMPTLRDHTSCQPAEILVDSEWV